MGTLRRLSARGDERLIWDQHQAALGNPEALAAIQEAERVFADARRLGATAFKIEPGQRPRRITRFDATAEQIVLIPRVRGG